MQTCAKGGVRGVKTLRGSTLVVQSFLSISDSLGKSHAHLAQSCT